MRPVRALLGTTLLAVAPAVAEAQVVVIEGRVLEDGVGEAVAGASVVALDPGDRGLAHATSDEMGRFRFRLRDRGPIRLRVSRVGYRATTTPALHFDDFDLFRVEVRLAPEAVLLAPLEVVARAAVGPSAMLESFDYRRRASPSGWFFTREDIERMRPAFVTDVVGRVPGVRLESAGRGTSRVITMARSIQGPRECPVQVFVDGFLMNRGGAATHAAVDDAVQPGSVEGIEVYRGLSGVPAEFMNRNAHCGVVAIWTRRGDARR